MDTRQLMDIPGFQAIGTGVERAMPGGRDIGPGHHTEEPIGLRPDIMATDTMAATGAARVKQL
jgi:hypothetical protein